MRGLAPLESWVDLNTFKRNINNNVSRDLYFEKEAQHLQNPQQQNLVWVWMKSSSSSLACR